MSLCVKTTVTWSSTRWKGVDGTKGALPSSLPPSLWNVQLIWLYSSLSHKKPLRSWHAEPPHCISAHLVWQHNFSLSCPMVVERKDSTDWPVQQCRTSRIACIDPCLILSPISPHEPYKRIYLREGMRWHASTISPKHRMAVFGVKWSKTICVKTALSNDVHWSGPHLTQSVLHFMAKTNLSYLLWNLLNPHPNLNQQDALWKHFIA